MQAIIWAFGSMLVLMIIMTFLSLGYSIKGKITIVMASFVLSLGGIAAMSSFSLLLTALLLTILVFFTAYIMDQRAGRILYGNTMVEHGIDETFDDGSPIESHSKKVIEESPVNFTELKKVEAIGMNKVDKLENDILQTTVISEIEPKADEEMTLLMERESNLEDVISPGDLHTEYEIKDEHFHFDENKELSIVDDEKIEYQDTDDLEPLDELALDFLLAEMEAAAEKDETIKEKILQK